MISFLVDPLQKIEHFSAVSWKLPPSPNLQKPFWHRTAVLATKFSPTQKRLHRHVSGVALHARLKIAVLRWIKRSFTWGGLQASHKMTFTTKMAVAQRKWPKKKTWNPRVGAPWINKDQHLRNPSPQKNMSQMGKVTRGDVGGQTED